MPQDAPTRPRWTSRKFIMAVSAQLASLIVLLWPGHESAIVEASTSITSLLVVLATSLGYLAAEGTIDARHASSPKHSAGEP